MNCPTCGRRMKCEAGGLAFPKPLRVKGRGCRVSDRDEAAKVRLGYTDPQSYVRRDGSEVLHGEDWEKRKREIWERGKGKCEAVVDMLTAADPCFNPIWSDYCKNEMHDPHHKVTRGKKRDDRASNLLGVCRLHHDLMDERKTRFGGR